MLTPLLPSTGPSRRALLRAGALAPLLASWPTGRAQAQSGVLRFGLSIYPPNLLPWQQTGTSSATVNLCTRRGLLSYDTKGELRGELAEDWHFDGTGWVFHLRNAVFHNLEPLDSADVRWSIEQMAAPTSSAYLRNSMQTITRIETPDPRTVRLISETPISTLPLWLALPQAPIISRHSPDTGAGAVGAGPFCIAGKERGVRIDLEPFDKFYRGRSQIEKLRMFAYADENLRVSALQAGDLDVIEYVPWQSIDALEANPSVRMSTTTGPFMYLTFNGGRPPFNDARVRQALCYAIKRDDVATAAFYGHAEALNGLPIFKDSPYYNAALAEHWRYDPAYARTLLAQAGYPDGFSCTLLANSSSGMITATAVVTQQNLAAIGITANLALLEYSAYLNLRNRGKYEVAVSGGTLDSNDPDGLTPILDGALPPSASRSWALPTPEITALLARGRASFDVKVRKAIYDRVQSLALEQVPICFLALRVQAYAMRTQVHGFQTLPGQLTFYSGYTLDETSIS